MQGVRRTLNRALGTASAFALACSVALGAGPASAFADEYVEPEAGELVAQNETSQAEGEEVVQQEVPLEAQARDTHGRWGAFEWNIYEITDENGFPAGCDLVFTYNNEYAGMTTSATDAGWIGYRPEIVGIYFNKDGAQRTTKAPVKSLEGLFKNYRMLKTFDGSGLDVSEVTDMSEMFSNCVSLENVYVDGWDVGSVTDMTSMFEGCQNLKRIDLSDWRPGSALKKMGSMFRECSSLVTVEWPSWQASNVEDMSYLFAYCSNLREVYFSQWSISALKNMSHMFYGCTSLDTLHFSYGWDTSKVTDMTHLFDGCSSMRKLDLSLWTISNNAQMTDMFVEMPQLYEFKVGDEYRISDGGFPTSPEKDEMWWSVTEGKWFSNSEIMAKRQRTADTYRASTYTMRLAGDTRYDTMSAIVSEIRYGGKWLVLTTGDNFPDALAASALAGVYDCPIVLTASDELSRQAAYQLGRLSTVKNVIIVGGSSAVSNAIKTEIEGMGKSVERISGTDRFDTCAKVLERVKTAVEDVEKDYDIDKSFDTVAIATGASFADALSFGPLAYVKNYPVLLAGSDGRLSTNVVNAIKDNKDIKHVILVGGDGVVSDQVKTQLGNGYTYSRLGGTNRYQTSWAIADYARRNKDLYLTHAAVATGKNFPDALAGTALCGSKDSVLLLADAESDPTLQDMLFKYIGEVESPYILGGTSAVSTDIEKALTDRLATTI